MPIEDTPSPSPEESLTRKKNLVLLQLSAVVRKRLFDQFELSSDASRILLKDIRDSESVGVETHLIYRLLELVSGDPNCWALIDEIIDECTLQADADDVSYFKHRFISIIFLNLEWLIRSEINCDNKKRVCKRLVKYQNILQRIGARLKELSRQDPSFEADWKIFSTRLEKNESKLKDIFSLAP